MRVLYVVHNHMLYEHSGTPILAGQYARSVVATGGESAIVFRKPAGVTPPSCHDGVTLIPVRSAVRQPWSLAEFSYPLADSRWTKSIKRFRPDLVHIVDWVGIPSALLAAVRTLDVPVVRHVCNVEDLCAYIEPIRYHEDLALCRAPLSPSQCGVCLQRRGDFRYSRLARLRSAVSRPASLLGSFPSANWYSMAVAEKHRAFKKHVSEIYDALIFPNQSFMEYYRSMIDLGEMDIAVIEHGVGSRSGANKLKSLGNIDDPIHFVFLGPCVERKGWNHIERAFFRLLRDRPGQIRLTAYGAPLDGGGSPLAGLPGVSMLPRFPHHALDDVLKFCDVGLIPSPFETFGLVCREMLTRGIPVIASDAFGLVDAVRDGENGLIITRPLSDGLRGAVEKILDNKNLLARLTKNAQSTSIRTEEDEFSEIQNLYYRLLSVAQKSQGTD